MSDFDDLLDAVVVAVGGASDLEVEDVVPLDAIRGDEDGADGDRGGGEVDAVRNPQGIFPSESRRASQPGLVQNI